MCRFERLPQIVGAITALDTDDAWEKNAASLAAGSSGLACLSWALQQHAPHLSPAYVFRLEYVAALHCGSRLDFAEGYALPIYKDQRPHWQPAAMNAVAADSIEGLFASPWPADADPVANLSTSQYSLVA